MQMQSKIEVAVVIVAVLLWGVGVGCTGTLRVETAADEDSSERETDAPSDQTQSSEPKLSAFAKWVKSQVRDYENGDFEKVTAQPFPSEAATGQGIDIWISSQAADDYISATFDSGTSQVPPLPENSIIVRAIKSRPDEITKYTVIAQRPPGFHQKVGGLWFGVMNTDFEYQSFSDGRPKSGALDSCASCHTNQKSTGYLYGVPNNYLAESMR